MLLKGRVQEYGVPYLGERGRCLQIASAIIGFLSDPGIPGVRSMGASVSFKVKEDKNVWPCVCFW